MNARNNNTENGTGTFIKTPGYTIFNIEREVVNIHFLKKKK